MLKRTFKWKRLLSCVLILALVMSFAPFAWALDENDLDNQVVNSVVEERDAIQNQPNQNDPDEFEEDIPDLTEDDAESHTVEVVPLEGELETPGEFVTDGSFEATAEFAAFEEEREPGKWYATGATISTSGARTGSKCARFTDANYTIEQDVEGLTIGETYYLSLWTQVGSGKVSLKIANYDGDKESSIQTKMAGGGYQNLTIPFTYKDEEKAPRISISTTGFMYSTTNVDDVSLTLDRDVSEVEVDNGSVTITMDDTFAGEVKADLFTVSYVNSLYPNDHVSVTDAQVAGKTVTFSFEEIEQNPLEQNIVFTIAYKTSGRVLTRELTIESTGGEVIETEIVTLTAENGQVAAVLEAKPTHRPVQGDFTLQYKIDGDAYQDLEVKNFSYSAGELTIVWDVETLAVSRAEQNVTVQVLYGDEKTASAAYVIPEIAGNTYYIDATEGDDGRDGLTPETAWRTLEKINATTFQPDDKILFQCGETWTGWLMPKGSGVKGAPIVIASYGDEEEDGKPCLMPGEDKVLPYFNVMTDVLKNKPYNNAITFYNQQYWEIRDLELYDPNFEANRPAYGPQTEGGTYRRAINLMGEDCGDLYGFTIDNVTMHGFRGPNSNRGKSSGGIIITILSDPNDPSKRVPTAIHDITVTNCEMYDLGRSGFNFTSPWTTRVDANSDGDEWGEFGYKGYGDWYPCRNIYIANNIIHDIDGDGVLIDGCENVLAEHNTVYRTFKFTQMAVGMFNWNSDYTVFQYNEVYDVCPSDKDPEGKTYDAQGIEIDALNRDTLVQYNYVHNNRGGVFMWCCTPDLRGFRGIYRYNISQGDGGVNGIINWANQNHVDSMAYNNTIYIPANTGSIKFFSGNQTTIAPGMKFLNNIFYNMNPDLKTDNYQVGIGSNISWKNNIFYGFEGIGVPSDPSNLQVDPKLAAPGTGGTGMGTVDGYRLQEGSPAIDAGAAIPALSDAWTARNAVFLKAFGSEIGDNRDYFGTELKDGKPDIGAAEFVGGVTTTFMVEFNSQGGTAVDDQVVHANERAEKPVDPTRNGYTFIGWYSDEDLTSAYDFTAPVTEDLVLYAKWEVESPALDTALLEAAIADAEAAKTGIIIIDSTPSEVSSGTQFVSTEVMNALNTAIAAAEEALGAVETEQAVAEAAETLNAAVALFESSIQTGTYVEPSYNPPSNTTTNTEKNEDGSTTKTVTNKSTGTVTETTTYPNGDKAVVETKKDGTVTETVTKKDGYKSQTVTKPDGSFASKVTDATGVKTETAATVEGVVTASVTLPEDMESAKVTVPVKDATPGTVAVVMNEDGTETILKTSVATEDGLSFIAEGNVEVKIVDNSKDFADVTDSHWAADAVQFAASRELFTGTGAGSFNPAGDMTRSMLVTVLARLDGQDTTGGETWYSKAMDWGMEAGITDGANMDASITRESLVVMLYRYAKAEYMDDMVLSEFPDADKVSDWAGEAMNWAVANGILTGNGAGELDPAGTASRAEVATILMRFIALY